MEQSPALSCSLKYLSWVSWTWNSYSTVPFPASAHSMYWLSGSRLLTSKQNFTNPAEGSIHLSLAAMDGSSLTCWQLPQTLREPQRMQQDLNSENFLWPSHGIDFRLSIKLIAGGDKFLSLHSYTVSIWAAVSASARSMALLPILPYVGLVTSSQHHLKSHQLQHMEEQMSWGCCSKHIKGLPADTSQSNAENWSEDKRMNKTSLKHWCPADRPIPCNSQVKGSFFWFFFWTCFSSTMMQNTRPEAPKGQFPLWKTLRKKMGSVVAQGRETQLVPGRHTKIT